MAKRKAKKNREEDSKRERYREEPVQNAECKKEVKEKEHEDNEESAPDIKTKTCTPAAIKELLAEIGEKCHQFLKGMQIKGHNNEGTIAIMSSDEMYEEELYEQMLFHLGKNHGIRQAILDAVNEKYGEPKNFNVHWSKVLEERYKRYNGYNDTYKPNRMYKCTVLGELIDEIFKVYEIEQFSKISDKGNVIITLLERLKMLFQYTYQVSEGKIEIRTEKSKYSIDERKIEWEERGEIIAEEAFKDYQSLGVTTLDRVTHIDDRPGRAVLDLMNRELRVPKNKQTVFGHPIHNCGKVEEKTDECIMNAAEYLRDRLENRPNSKAEIQMMEKWLEKLVEVSSLPRGIERTRGFEEFTKEALQDINWLINPEDVENVFMTLDCEEIKVTYREALENALGRLNANQYSERPGEVTKIQEIIAESFNRIIEETRDFGNRVYVRINSGADGSIEDEEEADTNPDKDWNLVGECRVLATKIVYNKVQCGKECSEEPMYIELFKVSIDELHKVVSEACVGKEGIQKIIPKITEKVKQLDKVVNRPESEKKRGESVAVLEEITRLSHVLQDQVDNLTKALTEAELGVQNTIQSTGRLLKKLKTTKNPNDCHATIMQTTLRSVKSYRDSKKWILPKVIRPETCFMIKEVIRTLMRSKRYKLAFRVSLHITMLKSMGRASVIIKTVIVRFAELRALELRADEGHQVEFTGRDKTDLDKYAETLKTLIKIDMCEVSSTRLCPNPEVIEDVFEKVEAREAEERKRNFNADDEESSEAWEAYLTEERELPREFARFLRRNQPNEFIALSLAVFKEHPMDFTEHGPTTASERVEFYEAQTGRWMKNLPGVHENELENKPEDYQGYVLTEEELGVKCRGSNGVESIFKYPGLIDAKVEINMFVMSEVIVPAVDLDARGRNPFLRSLPKESYGGSLRIPGALYYEREISRRRAAYTGDALFRNSNLSKLCVGGAELTETGYSCGKGCKLGDPRCPSGKKKSVNINVFPDAQFNPVKIGTCMREWCQPAKSHVNLHVVRDAFNSAANYNGGGVVTEQLVVVNPENNLHHQVVRLVRICVLLDKRLAAEAITYIELLSHRPMIIDTHMPESLGIEDLGGETRPVDILRIGSLHLPRCVANTIYIASNCATGTNATDENIAVPGSNKLHMCQVCYTSYLSPVSLLIHLLYEEEILGNLNKMEGDHSGCKRYAVCKCRLLKRLKTPQTDSGKEDFMYYNSEDIDKVGNRRFELYSLVQLCVVDSIDLALMELHEFTDMFILLNQIGVHVYLPGGSFARRWNLYIATHWKRNYVFGNLFKCMISKTKGSTHSYLPGDVWKMEMYTSMRMSHRGELYEIGPMEAATELVDSSMCSANSCERFGSVGNPGLAMKHNTMDKEKLRLFEDRTEEEMRIFKCFFNVYQEILNQSIIKFCLVMQTTKNKLKTYPRKIQILRVLKQMYQNRAVLGGIELPSLMKIPVGKNPFNNDSLYDSCYGEIIRSMPENTRCQPFEVNLNEYQNKEIFTGMELTVKVPGTKTMPKVEELVKLITRRLKTIEEKGWRKLRVKGPSVQRAKSEDFRTEPKMSEEDRQKKLAEIKKKIEKENAENVLVLQRKWRCEQCRLAHPTTGKRFPEHRREGCYKTLKSNKERKNADKEIEKEIEENKEKRIAKEMEELKGSEDKVNDHNDMNVEDEVFYEAVNETETFDQESAVDVLDNEVIKRLDEEATGNSGLDHVHVRMRGVKQGRIEPVWNQHSLRPDHLETILEEGRSSEEEELERGDEDDDDETIEEKMQRRTAEQKASDELIQQYVDSLIDTWKSEESTDKVKKEQKDLAKSIFLQTRKMAKKDYSLTTFLKNSTRNNFVENNDDEKEVESVPNKVDENVDENLSEEPFEDHAEAAMAESDELPKTEESDIVDEADYYLLSDDSDTDESEEEEVEVAEDPLGAPGFQWCSGGYDEDCKEYNVCGKLGCLNCHI